MLEVDIESRVGSFFLDCSFSVDKGIVAIMGQSGAGKSMLLKNISGIINPQYGIIKLNGRTLFSSKENININPGKRKIGYLFQNYALFPHMNVFDNIGFGLINIDKNLKKKKIFEMIEKMHLSGLESRLPHQLSGGQQQRVALARTLITDPELILLDEPLSALDSHIKESLLIELFEILKNNYQGNVLIVTHNLEEAYRLSDKIIIFHNGKIVQYDEKQKIIHSPNSLISAKITGCKNIFEIKFLEEKENCYLFEFDGEKLKARKNNRIITENRIYAGIRSQHIEVGLEEIKGDNVFKCNIIDIIEGLYTTMLNVKFKKTNFVVDISNSRKIDELKFLKDIWIRLPEEKLFLLME